MPLSNAWHYFSFECLVFESNVETDSILSFSAAVGETHNVMSGKTDRGNSQFDF